MDISVESITPTVYFPLFGDYGIGMTVVHVTVEVDGTRGWLSLSQREDDNGLWVIDTYLRNGMPIWVHSDGERLGTAQVAQGELLSAILEAVGTDGTDQ